ncbi:low temperature requirement protein A [Nocardia sp. FBN12]|uniref:low temperature requirement protein A n=1 Tax=Nocardia sp. FBN12 TaxID=3419766 RepID=UPI003CFEE6D8
MKIGMPQGRHRQVSPLELFFDLVFVLAISQLTHHLVAHLTWRGATETLVMAIAVSGVWAFTTFEVTMLDIARSATRAIVISVMALGLFMNAGIANAFGDSPWLFVVPMLIALTGPSVYAAATAPTALLRRHFRHVLTWFAVSAPAWVVGSTLDPDSRLWWWAVAAFVDLIGVWTAHPIPGVSMNTQRRPFDSAHMLERVRLFLIILLGETVMTLGRSISEHHSDELTLLLALGCFIALVCLWVVYFGRAEQLVEERISDDEDPIRSVHIGINITYGVVTGLVMFAAGIEILLAHVHDPRSGIAGILMFAGPAIYLLSHAIYFHRDIGVGWLPRLVGATVLAVAAATAFWLPAYIVVTLLVAILVTLAGWFSRTMAHWESGSQDPAGSGSNQVLGR